jgi:hypothetical protein
VRLPIDVGRLVLHLDGNWFNGAAAALHASKLESRTARIPLVECNCKSWQANQIGSQIREWYAPELARWIALPLSGVSLPHIKLVRKSCCFPARHCETLPTSNKPTESARDIEDF